MISPYPIQFIGFFYSNFHIKSQKSDDIFYNFEKVTSSFNIFYIKISGFWFIKGGTPEDISNNKIPKDHKSTDLSCPSFKIISGDKYSGVPNKVWEISFSLIYLLVLKSVKLEFPCQSNNICSGLRSQ